MKKILIFGLAYLLGISFLPAQELNLMPIKVDTLPAIDLVKFEKFINITSPSEAEQDQIEKELGGNLVDILYSHKTLSLFYGEACSWYCLGEVASMKASSSLPGGYSPRKAHDFSITTAWVEGAEGDGVGEYLQYTFKGNCPRITKVQILNGYVKSESTWRNNGRVKKLLMYYNHKPYAVLNLEDSRSLQIFDVGVLGFRESFIETGEPETWTLTFEILEVYPGEKYQDTAISDLYFDGIDVH